MEVQTDPRMPKDQHPTSRRTETQLSSEQTETEQTAAGSQSGLASPSATQQVKAGDQRFRECRERLSTSAAMNPPPELQPEDLYAEADQSPLAEWASYGALLPDGDTHCFVLSGCNSEPGGHVPFQVTGFSGQGRSRFYSGGQGLCGSGAS